ncbi:MAG TPA: hypothetical protein VHN78_11615, partial [Chloroflexota bacterium]|nr:hypothetical protein [Chloroflexota bacterium]
GYVGLVEGILERILAELGGRATVVATGGLAGIIVPETNLIEHLDPDLTLEGIRLVWERNRPLPPSPAARRPRAGPRGPRPKGEGEHPSV